MRTQTSYSANPSLPQWDEDDLVRRLSQSLDFAEQAVRQLTENGCDQLEEQSPLCPDKLVAETAILLLAASNVSTYSAIGPRILRVASLLTAHAHSQRMLRRICLEPSVAFEHAIAHICLKRLGFYDPDFDAMLDLAAAAQSTDGRERAPHRALEQEWLRQGWLYPEGLPRLRSNTNITNSSLNRTIDLLYGSREDVSGFTRALLCLRDFNLFPRPLPKPRECILAEAEGMLARCLDEQDYDLVAEVLLAWPLTGDDWSPAAAFAFRVLCNFENANVIPPAATSIDRIKSPEIQSGRRQYVATNYHHVYLMGLLAAATLAPGKRPPLGIPSVYARSGAFEAVFECFYPDDHKAHWQEELETLQPAERESLAEFLLNIALHREIGRSNFVAIERLLAVSSSLSLHTPVTSQATEMMVRVRHFTEYLEYSESLAPAGETAVYA
jgi:hypothetical protein